MLFWVTLFFPPPYQEKNNSGYVPRLLAVGGSGEFKPQKLTSTVMYRKCWTLALNKYIDR